MANWIKNAIKHPGDEKKAAGRAHESTHEYMEKHKNSKGKAGARARLGLRLSAMAKKSAKHSTSKYKPLSSYGRSSDISSHRGK